MRFLSHSIAVILLTILTSLNVQAATISLNPSSLTVSAGQTFSLDINISGVTDLYGFQFDLGFDPTVLSANSISEGAFLPLGGATLYLDGEVDNSTGTISNTANLLNGAVPGVDGSGILATVSFTALSNGSSNVNLFNPILLDSAESDIAIDSIQNGNINVATVPLPGAIWLFGSTLLSLIGASRRKNY